jgi:hypothetical protein
MNVDRLRVLNEVYCTMFTINWTAEDEHNSIAFNLYNSHERYLSFIIRFNEIEHHFIKITNLFEDVKMIPNDYKAKAEGSTLFYFNYPLKRLRQRANDAKHPYLFKYLILNDETHTFHTSIRYELPSPDANYYGYQFSTDPVVKTEEYKSFMLENINRQMIVLTNKYSFQQNELEFIKRQNVLELSKIHLSIQEIISKDLSGFKSDQTIKNEVKVYLSRYVQ